MRTTLKATIIAACVVAASAPAWAQGSSGQSSVGVGPQQELPIFLRRGLPGPGHAALKALEGRWRVEMSVYMVLGTPEQPAVSSDITCRREWVADGRYLQDVTEGKLAGSSYYRQGLLGYSNVDARYEWVTIDATNANMMIYLGASGSGLQMPITMSGVFTDQGWLGEAVAGKPVGMRTVITIQSNDRHVFDLYFTPPGQAERLVDRKVYTRIAN